MKKNEYIKNRILPHIDVPGKPFFVTACLNQSINAKGLKRVKNYREELSKHESPNKYSENEWRRIQDKLVFKLVDSILDKEPAAQFLRDSRAAEIVEKAFLYFADERYYLYSYVIMPSHHHWVFMPKTSWVEELAVKQSQKKNPRTPREVISHSIQSFTGNQCNKTLELSGAFWQRETYDHYVRDKEELLRIIHYIEHNPVKAGFVSKPEEYRWSSAYVRMKLGLKQGEKIPNPNGLT